MTDDDTPAVSMKERMRATVERMERLVSGVIVTREGAVSTLLETRDMAIDEQAWIREANDGTELALQYRVLMAAIEIHAAATLAAWPDDPVDWPPAKKLGEIQALLFQDFREILSEGEPVSGH